MIIYGNRLFGKVDQVPGLGHVATRFFHLDYVPLVPYEGWFVTSASGKTWRGVKIPMSAKSLLIAWGRTAGVVAGVSGVIGTIVTITGPHSDPSAVVGMLMLAVLGWGFFAFTKLHKSCTRASYKRACELGKLLKLTDAHMAKIAQAYGEAPVSYGFQPVQPRKPAIRQPAAAIPLEPQVNDFEQLPDQLPMDEVTEELIPVEGEDDDDNTFGLAVEDSAPTPSTKPRGETRRHG